MRLPGSTAALLATLTLLGLPAAARDLAALPAAGQDVRAPAADVEVDRRSARWAGANRADTARLIATDATPWAAQYSGRTVILTRQDIYPDGLAGAYLGGLLEAPILLTPTGAVALEAAQAVEEIDPDTVIVLGSPVAVSDAVAEALAGPDRALLRLGGVDRYHTAALIARAGGPLAAHGVALVASGRNFPDALVGAALSAAEAVPLLLTDPNTLPAFTADALTDLGVRHVLLAGGPAAVSENVRLQIEQLGISVQRVAGADRYATAAAFAEHTRVGDGWSTTHVNLATGENFADALSLGPHAGRDYGGPAPILLTRRDALPAATESWLRSIASCEQPFVQVAGGRAAISDAVVIAAVDALTADGCPADDDPPEIVVTSHTFGQTVALPNLTLTLSGTVSDMGGVRTLELFIADQLIGTIPMDLSTDPPTWSVVVGPPTDGLKVFHVVATDGFGHASVERFDLNLQFPTEAETVIAPDVVTLDAAQAGAADASDPDTGTVTFPTDQLPPGIQFGAIIAMPPTPRVPGGALGRVTFIEAEGAWTRITLTPVPLTDVILQTNVSAVQPLDPGAGNLVTGGSVLVGSAVSEVCGGGTLESPLDGTDRISSAVRRPSAAANYTYRFGFGRLDLVDNALGHVTVGGALTLTVEVDLGLDVDIKKKGVWKLKVPSGAEVQHFHLILTGTQDLDLLIDAAYDGALPRVEEELVRQHLGTITIPIGPVPIPIDVELVVEIGIDGSVRAAVAAQANQNAWVKVGTAYDDGVGWQDRSGAGADVTYKVPTMPDGALDDARVFADVSLRFGTKGVGLVKTGLEGDATARPYLKLNAASGASPAWTLSAGLDAVGEVRAKALGFTVFEPRDLDRNLFERVIVTADDLAPPPGGGAPRLPLIIPPTRSRSLAEALFYANVCDPGLSVEWFSDVDGLFATGPIGRGSLSPGRHTISVVVSEDGSSIAYDEMTFDQSNFECADCPSGAYGHFDVVDVAPPTALGALTLAEAMTDQESLVTNANFIQTPLSEGPSAAHGVVSRVPGIPVGEDGVAAALTTGWAYAADNLNTTPDVGHVHGDSPRGSHADDVTILGIDIDVPPESTCLQFDARFYSEEFPEYTAAGNTDRFIAQLDGFVWETTAGGATAFQSLTDDALGEPLGVQSSAPLELSHLMGYGTTFDGATRVLRVQTPVTPGLHTLFLSLFDHSGGTFDSMVVIDGLRTVHIPDGSCVAGVTPRG